MADESPKLPKLYTDKRLPEDSISVQLATILIDHVNEVVPGQYARYLTTEEGRYLLIQKSALDIDLLLRKDQAEPSEVVDVLAWYMQDSFWRVNIRSGAKFREQYSRLKGQMTETGFGTNIEDPNVDITMSMIGSYRALINNPCYNPTPAQHEKFVQAASKAKEFYPKHHITDPTYWGLYVAKCLEERYQRAGGEVHPGHFSSDHTWDVLMPQYLMRAGLAVFQEA